MNVDDDQSPLKSRVGDNSATETGSSTESGHGQQRHIIGDTVVLQGAHSHFTLLQECANPSQPLEDDYDKTGERFLQAVKDNLNEVYDEDIKDVRISKNLKEVKKEFQPRLVVTDLERKLGAGMQKIVILTSENPVQIAAETELDEISLTQLHDKFQGQDVNHVMLVGDVGSGKSITAMRYAKLVSEGKVDSLRGVQMVHLVQMSELQHDTHVSAFDIIADRIGLDSDCQKEGKNWLRANPHKSLFVIDGLDQASEQFGGEYPKLKNPDRKLKVNSCIANILSGDFYPGMKILSTTRRPNYWDLHERQKPDKVVTLKGFTDFDRTALLSELTGRNLEAHLEKISPPMLSICKDPAFLMYMAEILVHDEKQLPESQAELMSLFLNCLSDYSKVNIQQSAKLAFYGIDDKSFEFSPSYLKKHGIDRAEVEYFTSVKASSSERQGKIKRNNVEFRHQSFQEFLAALHPFSMDQEELKTLVFLTLNKTTFRMVRRFLYGFVFDSNTRRAVEPFIENKKSSIDFCEKVLMENLLSLVKIHQITDMELILLLHEAGRECISRLKAKVESVSNLELESGNLHVMSSVIQSLRPVSIHFESFKFSSSSVQFLEDIIRFANKIQIREAVITTDVQIQDIQRIKQLADKIEITVAFVLNCSGSAAKEFFKPQEYKNHRPWRVGIQQTYESDVYACLGEFLGQENVEMLNICRNLNGKDIQALYDGTPAGTNLKTFVTQEISSEEIEFSQLAVFAAKANLEKLAMTNCHLTSRKLKSFNEGARANNLKVDLLWIEDKNMDPPTFGKLAETCSVIKATTLKLLLCNLNKEKLESFNAAAKDKEVRVDVLQIEDKNMDQPTFGKLAETCNDIKATALLLVSCDLNKEKLEFFDEVAKDKGLQVNVLRIEDKNMDPPMLGKLAETCNDIKATTLALHSCNLTMEGLESFNKFAKDKGLQVNVLEIGDKNMDPPTFGKLAETCNDIEAKTLILLSCNLNMERLESFNEVAKDKGVQVNVLHIEDKNMDPPTFGKLAETCNDIEAKTLLLVSCNLNMERLESFNKVAKDKGLQLSALGIMDSNMNKQALARLADAAYATKANGISFHGNVIPNLQHFANAWRPQNTFLKMLQVNNQATTTAFFEELPEVLRKINCQTFILQNCSLTDEGLQAFRDVARTEHLKLERLTVMNDSVISATAMKNCAAFMKCISASCFLACSCKLSSKSIRAFRIEAEVVNLRFQELSVLIDPNIDIRALREIALLAEAVGLKDLILGHCGLAGKKLHDFANVLNSKNIKLSKIILFENKSLDADTFGKMLNLFETSFKEDQCNDTFTDTLHYLSWTAQFREKAEYFAIAHYATMSINDVKYIANICWTSKLRVLWLHECNLTEQIIAGLHKQLTLRGVKLDRVIFSRRSCKASEPIDVALSEFLSVVTNTLELRGWNLELSDMDILQTTVNQRSDGIKIIISSEMEWKDMDQANTLDDSDFSKEIESAITNASSSIPRQTPYVIQNLTLSAEAVGGNASRHDSQTSFDAGRHLSRLQS